MASVISIACVPDTMLVPAGAFLQLALVTCLAGSHWACFASSSECASGEPGSCLPDRVP